TIARDITVHEAEPPRPHAAGGSVWPLRNNWDRATENLYSAWIERLFDAPLDATLSWPALHQGLRDRSRNFLFNYLGLGEDEMGIIYRPDCAALPYFLRSYFAFKMGLPFGYSKCTRGGSGKPPKCFGWSSMQGAGASSSQREPAGGEPKASLTLGEREAAKRPGLAASFGTFLRTVGDVVHSGSARTPASDENTDYYPVPPTQDSLRPGTIYADPYGHVLVLAKHVAQTDDAAGVLLAVDAQPDGTVSRKRFWRGNFLFAHDPAL